MSSVVTEVLYPIPSSGTVYPASERSVLAAPIIYLDEYGYSFNLQMCVYTPELYTRPISNIDLDLTFYIDYSQVWYNHANFNVSNWSRDYVSVFTYYLPQNFFNSSHVVTFYVQSNYNFNVFNFTFPVHGTFEHLKISSNNSTYSPVILQYSSNGSSYNILKGHLYVSKDESTYQQLT